MMNTYMIKYYEYYMYKYRIKAYSLVCITTVIHTRLYAML